MFVCIHCPKKLNNESFCREYHVVGEYRYICFLFLWEKWKKSIQCFPCYRTVYVKTTLLYYQVFLVF